MSLSGGVAIFTATAAAAAVSSHCAACCLLGAKDASGEVGEIEHGSHLTTEQSTPSPVVAYSAKREWAGFFRRALPHSQDLSHCKQLPAFAKVKGDAAEDSTKPLWLALLRADGTHTRASLDTFENLDDKLVLARALAAAALTHLAPPTLMFEHDTPHQEIVERIRREPPSPLQPEHASAGTGADVAPTWVLKWAQGFGGQEIYFVRSAVAVADIITAAHAEQLAMLEAMPGEYNEDDDDNDGTPRPNQPGWVLQSMVPSVLVNGRKIHLRVYVIAVLQQHPSRSAAVSAAQSISSIPTATATATSHHQLAFYAYERYEVRLAAAAMNTDLSDTNAHLTTGVWRRGGVRDDRTTLGDVPELAAIVSPAAILRVLDELFGGDLAVTSGVRGGGSGGGGGDGVECNEIGGGTVFGMSGIDLMVTPNGDLFVLEINASPAAAPEDTITAAHCEHLVRFTEDVVAFVGQQDAGVSGAKPTSHFTQVGARNRSER